jgi:hypothetical protein
VDKGQIVVSVLLEGHDFFPSSHCAVCSPGQVYGGSHIALTSTSALTGGGTHFFY